MSHPFLGARGNAKPSSSSSSKPSSLLLRALALVLAPVMLAGCGLTAGMSSQYSADDPLTIRYADYAPVTASGPFDEFAQEIVEESDGRIELDAYWGGSLLGSTDLAAGTRAGVADIGIFTASHYASEYPTTNWTAALASMGSPKFPTGILQTYAGLADFAYNSDVVNQQFEDVGLKLLLPLHTVLKYDIICTSPVQTLEDARGKRVRGAGPLWDEEFRAAGMIPVNLPIEETYEGLQRGVIDCTVANPRTAMTYGFWEIAKYYVEVPFSGINSQYVVMNQSRWDSLSKEDQRILWDAVHTWWSENLQQDAIGEYQKFFEVAGEEQGVEILEAAPDFVDAVTTHQKKVVEEMPQDAPVAVEDPQAVVDDYRARMGHWLEVVEGLDIEDETGDLDLSEYMELTKTQIWDEHRP